MILNLYFPQYQGSGANNAIAIGAETLFQNFSKKLNFTNVECSQNISEIKNGIFSYDVLLENFLISKKIIEKESPQKIFLLGGDCSAELSIVSWLNQKYQNDLLVVWFDAHGDLNTPESSRSKNLNGMPLRTLVGEGDKAMVDNLFSILKIEQVVLAGARDLDQAEIDFIKQEKLICLDPENFENNFSETINKLKSKFTNVYIHCDLDAIDPVDMPYVKSITPNGLPLKTVQNCIQYLKSNFNIVGQSLTEYTGREFIEEIEDLILMH